MRKLGTMAAAALAASGCTITISSEKAPTVQTASTDAKSAAKKKGDPSAPGGNQSAHTIPLPTDASPGDCFVQVRKPAVYQSETQRVLVKSESVRYVPVAAKFAPETKRIKVRDKSEKYRYIPAKYKWVSEQVLVRPAVYKTVTVPAKFETRKVSVLVRPAHRAWRSEKAPVVKRPDGSTTGVMMRLVEVPAQYKTVEQRVKIAEADSKQVQVRPAEYKTVRKRVIETPARVVRQEIPAAYRTIKVRKQVRPASERKVDVPAVYQAVPKRVLRAPEQFAWRRVPCDSKPAATARAKAPAAAPSKRIVRAVQAKLKGEKLYHGDIDGRMGPKTVAALHVYQSKEGLSLGRINAATLRRMGLLKSKAKQKARVPVKPKPKPSAENPSNNQKAPTAKNEAVSAVGVRYRGENGSSKR